MAVKVPDMGATDWRGRVCASLGALALALPLGLLAGCTSGSAVASPTTPTAYVATGASVANPGNTVAVVDTVTSKALKPITTGTLPAALAVTPDGDDILVANKGVDTVSEIDVASGTVVKQVTVGLEPDAVAVSPNGALALVANFDDNTVTPLDLPSLRAGPTDRGGKAAGGHRHRTQRKPGPGVQLRGRNRDAHLLALLGGRNPGRCRA